jgi:DNA-binding MarR family transcriptional regulator
MSKSTAAESLPTLPMRNILSYRLSVLHALLTRKLSSISSSRSLNTHQWKVLSVLYFWPPITAVGISGVVVLDKAAISRAIGSLVRLKLAERRHDPKDNNTVIVITPTGRKLYGKIQEDIESIQRNIFQGLSAAKEKQLFEILDHIEQSLRWPSDD